MATVRSKDPASALGAMDIVRVFMVCTCAVVNTLQPLGSSTGAAAVTTTFRNNNNNNNNAATASDDATDADGPPHSGSGDGVTVSRHHRALLPLPLVPVVLPQLTQLGLSLLFTLLASLCDHTANEWVSARQAVFCCAWWWWCSLACCARVCSTVPCSSTVPCLARASASASVVRERE